LLHLLQSAIAQNPFQCHLQLLIRENTVDEEPVTTEGLTRIGFIQLQVQMLVIQRADLVWQTLIKFGYDRSLTLDPALYAGIPQHACQPVRPAACRQVWHDKVVVVSILRITCMSYLCPTRRIVLAAAVTQLPYLMITLKIFIVLPW
jgi:hypothetical protein